MCHSAKIMSEIFFIAAILPVSVIFAIIRHVAMATYCFNLAAILAVSVTHSSSRVITRDQQAKIVDTQNIRKTRRVAHLYIPNLWFGPPLVFEQFSSIQNLHRTTYKVVFSP